MEKKVIVIDDTELDGEVLKNLLSKADSDTQIVVSSKTALATLTVAAMKTGRTQSVNPNYSNFRGKPQGWDIVWRRI